MEPLFPEAGPPAVPLRPSLFELLAQEQLRDLLHPVFRYVLTYFAQRHPRYLLRFLNHHEECFAALLLMLERHHLRKHDASISEHFYQLRLTPVRSMPTPRLAAIGAVPRRKLSRGQRWGLLFFLVGLPYIRARAQDYYERLGGGMDPEAVSEEVPQIARTKAERSFKLFYPYANLGLDLTLLGYDLAYLFEKTDSYRPWHSWLSLRLERRGGDDLPPDTSQSSWLQLPPLLPPLLLLLKLSQWWYSPSSPRTLTTGETSSFSSVHKSILPPRPLPILPSSGLLPPTPPATPPIEDGPRIEELHIGRQRYQVDEKGYGKCPLCGRKWQNPAVLPSGWVVCWRCGWDAVEGDEGLDGEDGQRGGGRRRGRCPITGVEVAPGELRRVLV